jgi:K+-transporting ATPase ATPase C chain
MPDQANGSLEKSADGKIIGSRLIGQQWTDPQWFHGRPSATVNLSDPTKASPYNAANTTASNLGPTSKTLDQAQPELTGKALPSGVLTTSASGLDPDITPAIAALQVQRVAKTRGVPQEQIAALVEQHITPRILGIFGEPCVNLLELNLALQTGFPKR